MKFTLSWLKRHLETEATIDEVVEAMTLAGLEVEDVENPAEKLSEFSIGKVLTAEKHPDADKLKVCTVETRDGTKTIVCGAPNARADMTVAYAPLGAYIPGLDFSLDKKPRKIRGIESSGMMCSGKELEVDEDADGILDLPQTLEMGTPLADALNMNDPVIDFEVTPNRPDWLGVNSIARDLAAVGLGKLITPPTNLTPPKFETDQKIRVEDTEGCPAFVGRHIRGVKNGPSPKWLQDQLKAIGLRPISALVDITNYITYDRARPLHFYDVSKLTGSIIVRRGEGEKFEALDDRTYTATEDDVVIADESGILGLGGIVGGESSSCDENTTDILIESAYFDPLTIRRSAKRLGVNSDAKYRFERGVDTGGLIEGCELATQLVLEICGGEASDIVIGGEIPADPDPIKFDPMQVNKLTSLSLSDEEMNTILTKLGFTVKHGPIWKVTVPSFRRDCTEDADLVEEIARIHGYHNLEAVSLPPLPGRREPTATLTQNRTRLARRALALRGLSESVTWSFALDEHAALFGGDNPALRVDNPISNDLNTMRPSALIHLLLAGQRNADKGYPGAALFELGPVFDGQAPNDQSLSLAGMRRVESVRDWSGMEDISALTAKADTLEALDAMGVSADNLMLMEAIGDYWHPGRSGSLRMGPKKVLANFGELHPRVLKAMGIEGRVVAFEIWPEALPAPRKKNASKSKGALTLSDFMPVTRDFAFIVPDATAANDVLRAAQGADKKLISNVTLFDIYQGKGVEEGHKSLAIEVTLAPTDATLTDKEIDAVSDKIIEGVMKVGGRLRG